MDKINLDNIEWHKKQVYIKNGKRNCSVHWPYTCSAIVMRLAGSVSAAEDL